MLRLKTFSEESMKQTHIGRLQVGNYSGLLLRFVGTNAAGQVIAHSDLGTIEFSIDGRVFQNVDLARLKEINENYGGHVESVSVDDEAFALSVFVPFEIPGFRNALSVLPGQSVVCQYNPGANVATRLGAETGTLRMTHIEADVAQRYILRIGNVDRTHSDGQTSFNEIPAKNIHGLLIGSASGYNENLNINRDGKNVFNAKFDELLSATSFAFLRESLVTGYGFFTMGKQNSDLLADNVSLEISTSGGADTVYITYVAIDTDSETSATAQARVAREVQTRVSRTNQKDAALVKTIGDAAGAVSLA
mgnify:CR=1 FL=1